MRLVKEEYHAGLFHIAYFRQSVKKLGEHPEKESAVDSGALDKALTAENIDVAAAVHGSADPVGNIQRGLTEELLTAFILEGQKRALDGAYAGSGHIAVLGSVLGSVIANKLNHGAKVIQIYKEKLIVLSYAEYYVENTLLNLGKTEESGKEHGAHVSNRYAHRDALFAENIPEAGGIALILKAFQAEALYTATHILRIQAGLDHTGEVALYVSQKHGNTHVRKGLRQNFHGNGLAGTGGTCNETVAVCHFRKQIKSLIGFGRPYFTILIHLCFPLYIE